MNHAAGVLPNLEALNPSELKALIVEQYKQLTTQEKESFRRASSWSRAMRKSNISSCCWPSFVACTSDVHRKGASPDRAAGAAAGELEQSRALEADSPKPSAAELPWPDRRGDRYPRICGVKCKPTCRNRKLAPTVAES